MARFDVYKMVGEKGYLLDIQTDLLTGLNTRVVVPLMPRAEAPIPAQRLNPVFEIENLEVVMATQFMAAIPAKELNETVDNLGEAHQEIAAALDMPFSGF